MKKDFLKEFMEIRDSMLDDIKENEHNYNKFINYWSKILDTSIRTKIIIMIKMT